MTTALEMIGYDAIALGEKDLAFGREYLLAKAEEHGLPFVCANAVDAQTDEAIFPPYIVVEKEGVRIAFFGVVSPERHIVAQVESELLTHKIRIEDPTEHVLKHWDAARAESDLTVLLSHTGIETSEFLAEDLAFDVVIVGHYPAVGATPRMIEETIVAMAGSKSDRFGTLDLTLGESGGITEFTGDAVRLLKKGPQIDEIQVLFDEQDRREKEARRAKSLARQRDREAEQQKGVVLAVHERNGIYGAESCKSCHSPVYDAWSATPHATAFATLAEADAWDNPDCIGCHVTGIEHKDYVSDVNVAPEIWNVQCEECHGSGFDHARDGSYVTQGEATCRKCHDAENSPEFDYALYKSYGVH